MPRRASQRRTVLHRVGRYPPEGVVHLPLEAGATPPVPVPHTMQQIFERNLDTTTAAVWVEAPDLDTHFETFQCFMQIGLACANRRERNVVVTVLGIRMRLRGRQSHYDLFYFPRTHTLVSRCVVTGEIFV